MKPLPPQFWHYDNGERNKGGNAKIRLARILKRLKAKRETKAKCA